MLFWNISLFFSVKPFFRLQMLGIEIEHSSLAQRPGENG